MYAGLYDRDMTISCSFSKHGITNVPNKLLNRRKLKKLSIHQMLIKKMIEIILKESNRVLEEFLSGSGIFPNAWKRAHIIPLQLFVIIIGLLVFWL